MRNCVDSLTMVQKRGRTFGREVSKFKYYSSSIDLQRAQRPYYLSLSVMMLFHFTLPEFSLKELMLVVEMLSIKAIYHFRNTHISLPNLPRSKGVDPAGVGSFRSFKKTFLSLILAILGSWVLWMLWLAWHCLGAEELGVQSVEKPASVFIVWEPLTVVVCVPGKAGRRREVFSHVGDFWTLIDQIKWHCIKSGCQYAAGADYGLVVTWVSIK